VGSVVQGGTPAIGAQDEADFVTPSDGVSN
jgi:hypothetical protein